MQWKKISIGEIYVADLNPYQGSEQGGIRPVVILQNDAGNYFSSTTIVASLPSHVAKKENLPTHVFINSREDLEHDSIIMCEQIRTIDKSRLIRCLGRLDVWDGGSWRGFERKIRMLWWLIKYKCWQSNLFWEYKILFLARWK